MRHITQEDFRGLYRTAPPSLYDDVRAALAPLPEGKEQTVVKKKISISIVLAAALAILSVTALAAGGIQLFRHNGTENNPIVPLDGAEELVVTKLGQAENAHAILSVEEAVYDGQGVMALLKLTPKDTERFAMYNPYCQDAQEEVYEMAAAHARVGWGWFTTENQHGSTVEVSNEHDFREVQIDDQVVPIPDNPEDAIASGTIVYMDGDVMRVADREAEGPVARKDGRALIDYDFSISTPEENGLLNGLLSNGSAEGQDDGSALIWYNAYGENVMADDLELTIAGTTTLDGEAIPMPELRIQLKRAEPERRYRLVPETDVLAGQVKLNEAAINVSRLRSYVYLDYERLPGAELEIPWLRVTDEAGKSLMEGRGWMSGNDTNFLSQYEAQPFEPLPDRLVIELADEDDNVVDRVRCEVVEEK